MTGTGFQIGDHIQACLKQVHPEVSKYSRPLFAVDKRNRPELFATCVFIEHNGIDYLVTAAHAIYEIEHYGSSVHLGSEKIQTIPTPQIRTSCDGSDPLDIAIMPVEREWVHSMNLIALPSSKLLASKLFERPHLHCMHGYPCTKNKTVKAANTLTKVFTTYAFTYAGISPKRLSFNKYKKNPFDHISLKYQIGSDDKGNNVTPPKPKGMSGGGLWIVPNSFKGDDVYLAGILIEQHGETIFATKIERVLEFIERNAQSAGSVARKSQGSMEHPH